MKEQNVSGAETGFEQKEEKRRGAPEKPQNQNFYMRVLCLILVIGAIFFYNYTLKEKEQNETISDLTQKVEELESQQKEILAALEENYEARKKAEEAQQAQEAAKTQEEEDHDSAGNGQDEEAVSEEESSNVYQNGTYTGDGEGFGGNIQVQITIEDDVLTDIHVLSAPGEDSAYINQGKAVIDRVLSAQSTDVDTVSGATFSSTGILMAIEDALGKAEKG